MYGSGYQAAVTSGSSPAASLPTSTTLPRPMAVGAVATMAHGTLPAHAAHGTMPSSPTQAYWSPGDARRVVVSQQPQPAQPVLRRSLGSSGALQSSSSASATPVAASIEMEKELSRRLDLCQEELVRERSRSEELAAELHEARQSKDSEVEHLRQQLAIRERELVAAASARHRCAARSEALATSLRSKLTELEAYLAPRSPSVSSRGSGGAVAALPEAENPAIMGPPPMERAAMANGFRGQSDIKDFRRGSHRWRAAEVGTQEAAPTQTLEFQEAVAQILFQRCDARGCGTLSWKDGEVMNCLQQLLMAYRIPLPELSPESLLAIYSQVKENNSEVEGLTLQQMCDFAQKVSEAASRWEVSDESQEQPQLRRQLQAAPAAWSWDASIA